MPIRVIKKLNASTAELKKPVSRLKKSEVKTPESIIQNWVFEHKAKKENERTEALAFWKIH